MNIILETIVKKPILTIVAVLAAAIVGWRQFSSLPVDIFPDIAVPRVVIQTEAAGLTAEEVEQRVTIPIESVMNGIPGISTIRSSSSGGLSFVWVEFEWNTDLGRARFDVFERLQRIREILPEDVDVEIAPAVSVTGEIMLVALTAKDNSVTPLELREIAEYELRPRLLAERGIGEVVVLGGRLPEYRISVAPRRLAEFNLSINDIIEAVRDTRTYAGAGYLASVAGDELPLRQIARADTLESIRRSPVVTGGTGTLRLADVADVSLAGAPRRGSASFEGREAVIVSVQKTPGGNTPEITARLDQVIGNFRSYADSKGIELSANAYRQADFIDASISGGVKVARDAAIVVLAVLVLTLFRLRTILVVLASMAITVPVSIALFPALGLGINVMTLGGFAIAAGDIVDASIIFAEVVWRRKDISIAEAVKSVAPGVIFSTLTVALVFIPMLMLSGLEGAFFRPLALSYLAVFLVSLAVAFAIVPAMSKLLGRDRQPGSGTPVPAPASDPFGVKVMKFIYRPFLAAAMKFPKSTLLVALGACIVSIYIATGFGSSFLPPFHEDSFNVVLSLPPGASLDESERTAESCVEAIRAIKGVKSVVRRTGRAERDQHAEPVSSSEYVVRVDMNGDTDEVRSSIRRLLGGIPGCSVLVGYPIAHRISAVLSGTETELAVNVYGEDIDRLRATVAKMKERLDLMQEVSDVRANREVTVRTLKIDYDIEALSEAGLTLREAGEQVSAAFNGVEAGEVREGLKIRSVTVRLEGFDNDLKVNDVGAFLLSSRTGRRVRLDDVARIHPEEASDLMLREGGRRKALISLNAAEGVDIGRLVDRLKLILNPIAAAEGMSVEYGGSYQARESAGERLTWLAAALAVAIFILLVFALKNALAAFIALFNIPLALIGGVAAVYIADPVLSVSSLVGFVTVTGFVLRNGILLLQRYRELEEGGTSHADAIREGSLERMVPILMTSLTTVLGLVPIIMAGDKPGGELLAPIAVVQFGGILGAGALNLAVLPAAALLLLKHTPQRIGAGAATVLAAAFAATLCGCRSYTAEPIDWKQENLLWKRESSLVFSSLNDVATSALVGNTALNRLRIERARAENVAKASGWWEDPELDMDFMRIVNPADNPFLGGASLSFSIPLSGVPGLERKAAEAYSKAAQNEIIAAERETAGEARMAAVRVLAARRTAEILNRFENDERIVQAFSAADRLVDAGELPLTDLMAAKRRRHDRTHKIKTAQNAADTAECELKRILGVSPDTALVFRSTAMHGCSHTSMPPAYAALDYIRHPRVCAALDRFAGSEAALEAEIRRQYPDLKLGPAYSREEGLDRFGIVAGVTVPLWNRNRKGIAEAEGSRNILRSDAVAVWRETVTKAATTRQRLARLLEHRAESSLRSVTEANQLADAGELDALAFIAVREEILDAELNEMEWKTDICLVSEELEMTNPKE